MPRDGKIHIIWPKTIAIILVCLFLLNDAAIASPKTSALSAEHIFAPLTDKKLQDIGFLKAILRYKLIKNATLFNSEKNSTAVIENNPIFRTVEFKFSEKEPIRKNGCLIPCVINRNRTYYAYVTQSPQNPDKFNITIYTKAEYKKGMKVEHRNRSHNPAEQKITIYESRGGNVKDEDGDQGSVPSKFLFIESIYSGRGSTISEDEFRDMLGEFALWLKDNYSPELIRHFQEEFFKRHKPIALRIVIDGGPSAGKSTMLGAIRETFGDAVACVPEAGRLMFEAGYPHPQDTGTRETFQVAYYLLQRISEDYYCGRHPGKILICDRGSCDGAGYWPKGKDDFYKMMLTTQEEEFARYQAIIHMESPAVNKPDDFVSDGVRGDVEASRIKDKNVREVWNSHPGWRLVEHTTFREKTDEVLALLSEFIGRGTYDADFTSALLTEPLYTQFQEDKIYEIKYDSSRLTASQVEIIKEYVRILRLRSSNSDNIILRPFSGAQGSKESLIAVYCSGKDFKGEGHVDVTIPDGELKEYLLRITGMVNIALASSNIPDNLSREEVDKYRPIMSYIKNQYKAIMGEELAIPDNTEDILKVVRRIVMGLPKSMRMNTDQIEEFNRLAKQALTAA